jgi:serine/threonine-protein kinase CLA4
MNPGPAPQPPMRQPTDRPRLALTPSINGMPGNQSQLGMLQSPSASSSTTSLALSRTGTEKMGAYQVVKDGWAKVKEEGVLKSMFWQDRFLVLREFQLDFLKSNNTSKVTASIQLRDVTNVSRSDTSPFSFEITRTTGGSSGASPPRDGPTKVVTCKVDTDDEVYSWIDSIYQRCPSMGGVSNPTNFTHRVHVGFDPTSGAFVGLPPEWERLLTASAITKDDYQKNPKAVLEVLEFYTEQLVKRQEEPAAYPSLTPTPAAEPMGQKQLGYPSSGASIAGPRGPPNGYQRQDSYRRDQTPPGGYQRPNETSSAQAAYAAQNEARIEEERRRRQAEEERKRQQLRERERLEAERREREEQAAYNASIPQKKVPIAKQELGGYTGMEEPSRDPSPSAPQAARYNPQRPAPSAPAGQKPQQPSGSLRQVSPAQRPAPPAPHQQNSGYPKPGQSPASSQKPPVSNARYAPGGGQQQKIPVRPQQPQGQPAQRPPPGASGSGPAPKPLNVQQKQQQGGSTDAHKKAEAALTSAPPKKEETRKDVRMSAMSESEVMAKLREVVSKDRPLDSYNKQKKIGQGASGSVYVARVRESAPSPTARDLLRQNGPRAQVAIKQMDLRNQPRKELIVNEIIVMKDSKHPNIVNFLDAFLQEEQSELWVVMEFMEGGALTDVIENNPQISEDQISTICLEVCLASHLVRNERMLMPK